MKAPGLHEVIDAVFGELLAQHMLGVADPGLMAFDLVVLLRQRDHRGRSFQPSTGVAQQLLEVLVHHGLLLAVDGGRRFTLRPSSLAVLTVEEEEPCAA